MRLKALVIVGLVTVATATGSTGCGGGGDEVRLRVAAASSLTRAMAALVDAYGAEHPEVEITTTFAGSPAIAEQLRQGAPVDVVAVADEPTMSRIVSAGDAKAPTVVARNNLAVVVQKGNPRRVTGLRDLGRPGLAVVLCAPAVPCGRLGRAALDRTGTAVQPVTLAENVNGVVSRIALGEADAGIAYATDVRAEPRVDGVALGIPDDPALQAVYPMAVTSTTRHRRAAAAFVEFVASPAGRRVLSRLGFLAP